MSIIKKLTATALIFIMVFSLAACHQKDESAMTFGNSALKSGTAGRVDIRAALYNLYMLQAESEAKTKVDEAKKAANSSTAVSDYFKEKIDKKDYATWISDRTIELCAQHAAIQLWVEKYKIKLTDQQTQTADYYSSNQWQQGASQLCDLNGIAKTTYDDFWLSAIKKNAVFSYLYGKGGPNEVKADEIKKGLTNNFVLADTLQVMFSKDNATLTEAEKKDAKAKLVAFAARLNKGESFDKIKTEFDKWQNVTADSSTSTSTAKDKNATVYGTSKTQKKSDYYDQIRNMAVGKIEVKEFSDSYMLVVRLDITKDPVYLEENTSDILSVLKGDTFTKDLETYTATVQKTIKKNAFAMGNFTPKKLKQIPTTTQQQEVATTLAQ